MLIAWKNIMARKWSSAKVALSILAMVIIMCIFTAYSVALSDETERITKSYRSAHNIIVETVVPVSDKKLEEAKSIAGIGDVLEIAICRNTKNLRGMKFSIGGKVYACDHDYYDGNLDIGTDRIVNRLHYGDFAFVKSGQNIALSHHDEEMDFRFKGEKSLLAGKANVQADELIVSEYFLQEFGLDANVLGSMINISIGGKRFGFKIVGIMNSHFYDLTDHIRQHFIASTDSKIFNDYFLTNSAKTNYQTKLYLQQFKLHSKLLDDVKSIITLNVRSITLGSEYGLAMSTTVRIIASILDGIMATVGLGIISALFLNIVYSMRFMMKKKNNFYAVLQVYGMNKNKMFEILFCEMFILSMIASIVAYAISYGLVYLLDYLMSSMVGIGVFFGWANFLITFAIAVIFTLIVVLIVCLINYSLYYKRSMSKMLKNTIEN